MRDYQAAARRYCEIKRLDPDAVVVHSAPIDPKTGYRPDVLLHTPRWILVANELRELDTKMQALGLLDSHRITF